MKRMVHWEDEENRGSEMDPFQEGNKTDASDDEHSDDQEPRTNYVLNGLSQLLSTKRAFDPLHSMAASKDILFWTPRGQLLRKNP